MVSGYKEVINNVTSATSIVSTVSDLSAETIGLY
jgi:hypothetical protein